MSTRAQQAVRYWPTEKAYAALQSIPPAHYNPPQLEAPAPDCRACGGVGEVEVGWERDTNAAITRVCGACGGRGQEVAS